MMYCDMSTSQRVNFSNEKFGSSGASATVVSSGVEADVFCVPLLPVAQEESNKSMVSPTNNTLKNRSLMFNSPFCKKGKFPQNFPFFC